MRAWVLCGTFGEYLAYGKRADVCHVGDHIDPHARVYHLVSRRDGEDPLAVQSCGRTASDDFRAPVGAAARCRRMTLKIRKLYNVLVIGGLAAAGCGKSSPGPEKPAPAAKAPKPAEPAEPVTVKPVEPSAAEAKPAEPVTAKPAEPVKPATKPVAAKPAATVPAQPPTDIGGGVRGWH